ncbi:MAG: hypothetical protein KKI06_00845 [Euryarchaeota archaeon]|nr:hypothetical protein [Euryarchaeota archaeon]MBU4222420.1 hypothetical protein [Euryarchaeota archaeon]MCG2737523.1 hypothetical protein [Candidatus Methanoperedenaceae archaeon]
MQEHTGTQNRCDNFASRLIFEKSRKNTFKKCPHLPDALARASPAIPELSEPEVIRHYTALSKFNDQI